MAFISLERTIFKRAGPDVTMALFWTFCNTRGSLVVFARASVLWESRHSQKSSCLSKSHERLASLCYSRQRPYILPKTKNQIKKKPESTYAMRNRRGTVPRPTARCVSRKEKTGTKEGKNISVGLKDALGCYIIRIKKKKGKRKAYKKTRVEGMR